MMLVINSQQVSFSTIDNVHSTPINAKDQVVLELVNPITLWTLLKQHCKQVFSNQPMHEVTLLQDMG